MVLQPQSRFSLILAPLVPRRASKSRPRDIRAVPRRDRIPILSFSKYKSRQPRQRPALSVICVRHWRSGFPAPFMDVDIRHRRPGPITLCKRVVRSCFLYSSYKRIRKHCKTRPSKTETVLSDIRYLRSPRRFLLRENDRRLDSDFEIIWPQEQRLLRQTGRKTRDFGVGLWVPGPSWNRTADAACVIILQGLRGHVPGFGGAFLLEGKRRCEGGVHSSWFFGKCGYDLAVECGCISECRRRV